MHSSQLPDAVIHEMEQLLKGCATHLEQGGYRNIRVHDLEGYPEPEELQIPVWNAPMVPDLMADRPSGGALVAAVAVSTDLGERSCGRRWQALHEWAQRHAGEFAVYVHPEDQLRATQIAEHWHLDPEFVEAVARAG